MSWAGEKSGRGGLEEGRGGGSQGWRQADTRLVLPLTLQENPLPGPPLALPHPLLPPHLEQALKPGPVLVADQPVVEHAQRLMGPESGQLARVFQGDADGLHALQYNGGEAVQ